jgi:zona occludens toxin (predicted ATPase)
VNSDDSLVRLVVGKLGSGKTFYAVIRAMEALMQGRVVVSNVEFNWPAVETYCRRQGAKVPRENYRFVDSSLLESGADVLARHLVKGAMVLLDEIHLFMDAREHRKNAEKSGFFQELLTQARKYDLDIWLVSQSAANVDARLVRQATFIVRVSNWLHLPLLGTLFPFPYTVARTCAPDGRTVYSRDWIYRSSKIGRLYDTKQKFKALDLQGAGALKVIGKKRKRAGYGVVLLAMGLGLLALDAFLDRERYDSLAEYRKNNPQPEPTVPLPPSVPASSPAETVPAAAPLPYDTLLSIEESLPGWVHLSQQFIHLENNDKLEIGSALGCGFIRSWRVHHAGRIIVITDSPLTPEISLFKYNAKPHRNYSDGRSSGNPSRGPFRPLSSDHPPGDGLGGGISGDYVRGPVTTGVHGDDGPRGEVPAYVVPAAVVVPTVGPAMRLPANHWIE